MAGHPRWDNPDVDLSIKPKKRPTGNPRHPRENQVKCGCGCGKLAGYHPDNNGDPKQKGKPRRFIPGHQSSKGGLAKVKLNNDMEREMAEEREREEIEAFELELDRLFEEGRELGLVGNALIAHVFTDDMEDRAVRRVLKRAVLEGNRDAINWAFSRKHGNASTKAAVTPAATPAFLDPLASEDEIVE